MYIVHLYDVTTLLTEGENLWQTTVGEVGGVGITITAIGWLCGDR